MAVYGRALKNIYDDGVPFFHVFFNTAMGSPITVPLNNPAGKYRLHIYGIGGRGGNGSTGTPNAGGGGASRGGIGITDIDLPANAELQYTTGYRVDRTATIVTLNGVTYYIGWGEAGSHGSGGTGGNGGRAYLSSSNNFNVLNYSVPAGDKGGDYTEGAYAGKGSVFTGDITVAKYTSNGTNAEAPDENDPTTWILGTAGDGGIGTGSRTDTRYLGHTGGYTGVVLERL